jgi:hypothetical protein
MAGNFIFLRWRNNHVDESRPQTMDYGAKEFASIALLSRTTISAVKVWQEGLYKN